MKFQVWTAPIHSLKPLSHYGGPPTAFLKLILERAWWELRMITISLQQRRGSAVWTPWLCLALARHSLWCYCVVTVSPRRCHGVLCNSPHSYSDCTELPWWSLCSALSYHFHGVLCDATALLRASTECFVMNAPRNRSGNAARAQGKRCEITGNRHQELRRIAIKRSGS